MPHRSTADGSRGRGSVRHSENRTESPHMTLIRFSTYRVDRASIRGAASRYQAQLIVLVRWQPSIAGSDYTPTHCVATGALWCHR
jgi:hypothetical protein